MYSFSKTLTATAIGFAEQEGILSLDEKLVDLFPDDCPEHITENLALADIQSLLTMSCGHAAEITADDVAQAGGNWVRAFLGHDFRYRPGTTFQYNTRGTDLLSAILQMRSGMTLTQYLEPRLFAPLGIEKIDCSRMGDRVVASNAPYHDVEGGGWGFHLKTEDMARIVWFLEQRGKWDGRQLLRETWFDRAVNRQIATCSEVYRPVTSNWEQGYCYQCWVNTQPGTYRADGAYGQFGYVLTNKDAIFVTTASAVNTEAMLNLFADGIGAKMADCALPENPEKWFELRRACENLALQNLWGLRQMWIEPKVEDREYRLENAAGTSLEAFIGGEGVFDRWEKVLRTVSLHFTEASLELRATQECMQTGALEQTVLSVGLDGQYRVSALSGRPYAASGCWTRENEMELEVRCLEAVGAARIRLSFAEDSLRLSVRSTIPEENEITERTCREIR